MNTPRLADDLLKGVTEVADYLGESPRRVYHLHQSGQIPTFSIGRKIHARKSQLDRHYGGDADSAES